jgi:plasmid stabilization system protein ParE
MKQYRIRYTSDAMEDIDGIYHYIAHVCRMPDTAVKFKYRNGIYDTIRQLAVWGGSVAVNLRESIQRRYGPDARTATYKKMTIIFNVMDDIVLIRRVMAGSLIV